MSTGELQRYLVTPEEYLAGELIGQSKHEYLAGMIYAMAGTTIGHSRIADNIARELGNQLRGKSCEVFSSDIKVRIRANAAEFYYYPDVTVDCGAADNASLFAQEPVVIFEVLSTETERIGRGEKLRNYQSLASLMVYVLVDQFRTCVTIYRRHDGDWTQELLVKKTDSLELSAIGCSLALAAIYERTGL